MVTLGDNNRKVQAADQVGQGTQNDGEPRDDGIGDADQIVLGIVAEKAVDQEFLKSHRYILSEWVFSYS